MVTQSGSLSLHESERDVDFATDVGVIDLQPKFAIGSEVELKAATYGFVSLHELSYNRSPFTVAPGLVRIDDVGLLDEGESCLEEYSVADCQAHIVGGCAIMLRIRLDDEQVLWTPQLFVAKAASGEPTRLEGWS